MRRNALGARVVTRLAQRDRARQRLVGFVEVPEPARRSEPPEQVRSRRLELVVVGRR